MIKQLIFTIIIFCTLWFLKKIYQIYNLVRFFLKFSSQKVQYKEPDIQKRISSKEIPQQIDYIIIGSGISGLMSAAILAKLNKKVVVLEQHDRAGGCLHTFEKEGYEFNTGLHYLGNDDGLQNFLKLVWSKPLEFHVQMENDMLYFHEGEKGFLVEGPQNTYKDKLKAEFPEQKLAIDKLFAILPKCNKLSRLFLIRDIFYPKYLRFLFEIIARIFFSSIYPISLKDKFKELGIDKNQKLVAIISYPLKIQGRDLQEIPCYKANTMVYFVNKGYCYPKEGSQAIVKTIVSTIEQNDGKVFTKARVEEILTKDKQVVGVKLRGGITLNCKQVISTMGLHQTIEALPEQLRWKVNYKSHRETTSFAQLFIGINCKGIEIPRYNVLISPRDSNYSSSELYHKYLETKDLKYGFFWLYFENKDGAPKDKVGAIMTTPYPTDWVIQYRKNEVERKEGYLELKKKIESCMVEKILEYFPQFKGRIEYINTATPLTYETYFNRFSLYGLEISNKKVNDPDVQFKFTTPIKGLYIAGEDTVGGGVVPSAFSGIMVVSKIMKLI